MTFTDEDKLIIKILGQTKNYSAKQFIRKFPQKRWKLGGLSDLLRRIDSFGTVERQAGSGRRRTVRVLANIEHVEKLILSQEDRPQTHLPQRKKAINLGISQSSVKQILKQDLNLKCFKKKRAQELSLTNKQAQLRSSRQLLRRFTASLVNFIWFTDEKLFTLKTSNNSQNDRVYAASGTKERTSRHPACYAQDRHSANPCWFRSASRL